MQQLRQIRMRRRRRPDDELRLPARAFQRHDRQPRAIGRDGRAVIALDHVQAQVHAGRCARRREHLAVVDEQHVGVHLNLRIALCQQVGGFPMRGGLQAVEDAAGGQDKRAGADGGNPCAR